MFCYSDNQPRSATPVNVWKMNPNKAFMSHYSNFLYLDFILNNGTYQERQQARKELTICERKMKFWERHPDFNKETVRMEKEKLHLAWKSGDRPDVRTALAPPIPSAKPSIKVKPKSAPKVSYEPDF